MNDRCLSLVYEPAVKVSFLNLHDDNVIHRSLFPQSFLALKRNHYFLLRHAVEYTDLQKELNHSIMITALTVGTYRCVAFTLHRTSELVPLGLATPWQ